MAGTDKDDSAAPHYHGHRERLRQRFREGGRAALADYELLELLLFHAIPRRDVKPLAKELIKDFRGVAGVLAASRESLAAAGLGDVAIDLLKATYEAGVQMTRVDAAAEKRDNLSSGDKVVEYCRAQLAYAEIEEFHVLFLDRQNGLIRAEKQARGTIDHAPVYPREIVKRALELGAAALILVHNHPSGNPAPSKADIETTRKIAQAAASLGMSVHDHIIVGREGHASLKALGVM
jgi:DNA repair protein RadC